MKGELTMTTVSLATTVSTWLPWPMERPPVTSFRSMRSAPMLADKGVSVAGRRGNLDFQPTANRADVRG